jgi:hypothetical protein
MLESVWDTDPWFVCEVYLYDGAVAECCRVH